jgi:hypothetical protein
MARLQDEQTSNKPLTQHWLAQAVVLEAAIYARAACAEQGKG